MPGKDRAVLRAEVKAVRRQVCWMGKTQREDRVQAIMQVQVLDRRFFEKGCQWFEAE